MHSAVIHYDCRHYVGSKPCRAHKVHKVVCETCQYYEPITKRILIIKCGAMGDVLRSTAILHQLSGTNTEITWITHQNAIPLLENNRFVDHIFDAKSTAVISLLQQVQFDALYSLDNDQFGGSLAAMAKAKNRFGFGIDENGKVLGYTKQATRWLATSIDDTLKKQNQRSYPSILFEICGLSFSAQKDTMVLPQSWPPVTKFNASKTRKTCGFVVGAGPRWPEKSLSLPKCRELIERLNAHHIDCILIGGPDESETINTIQTWGLPVTNTGTNNPIQDVIGFLDACYFVVTGDTLSMHIAVALKKRVYTFVGPSSAQELEPYGVMTLLRPPLDCVCCYLTHCEKSTKCNELVSLDPIFEKEG